MKTNCMYEIPPELTGLSASVCGLLNLGCNGYGKKCAAYRRHTKESREALKKVIAEKKQEGKKP